MHVYVQVWLTTAQPYFIDWAECLNLKEKHSMQTNLSESLIVVPWWFHSAEVFVIYELKFYIPNIIVEQAKG